jgi:YVTN family beta-propeller protein
MKKTVILMLAVTIQAAAVFAGTTDLYVSHNSFKKISVVDTSTNQVMNDIVLPCVPKSIKLSPDEQYLYIAGYDTNAIYRMKTRNMTVDADFVSVGYGPETLAIRPDNKRIYVGNSKSKNISIIDLPAFEMKEDPVELPAAPKAMAITNDGRKMYIALAGREGVALMDLATNKITGVIQTGADPWGMCIVDNRLFVTNEGMASISVIDMRKNTVINEIVTTDSPRGIAYFNGNVYVAVTNGIDIFDTSSYEKPASVGLDYPVYDVVYGKTPSGDKIYVAGYNKDSNAGKIAVIDPRQNEVETEIDCEGWPFYLEIRKVWPKPAPAATAAPRPTAAPQATRAFTPEPTSTPVPTATPHHKKAKKKPTPRPTAKPTPSGLTAALKGRVFMDNEPVPKIKIKAVSKHTDKIYTIYTDDSGRFIFDALPIGGYAIMIEATDIAEKAVAVVVNRGKNPEMVINVKKR